MRMDVRARRWPGMCLVLWLGLATGAQAQGVLATRQPDAGTGEAWLVVEIPADSAIKYELDPQGRLMVDRFLAMPMAYPANYGALPGTRGGDGDPLDALVITRWPVHPGALIRFRPVGVLHMHDDGQADEKIIGVPVDAVDASYAHVREIHDLPAAERDRIEAFFRVYKQLPAGQGPVELRGWGDAAQARGLIDAAVQAEQAR